MFPMVCSPELMVYSPVDDNKQIISLSPDDQVEMPTIFKEEEHRKFASALFNYTWTLIEKEARTELDTNRMINGAHASLFHWEFVGNTLNYARGEWLLSRVYALAGRQEAAMFHAERSLQLCVDNQLGEFDEAFAHEAVARACSLSGQTDRMNSSISRALSLAAEVKNTDDRKWIMQNVNSIETVDKA